MGNSIKELRRQAVACFKTAAVACMVTMLSVWVMYNGVQSPTLYLVALASTMITIAGVFAGGILFGVIIIKLISD